MSAAREVAWSFWRLVSDGRLDDALDVLDDRGTWWDIGRRGGVPLSEMKETLRHGMGTMIRLQARFTLLDAIEDGDRVVLEMESCADLPNGQRYAQVYCVIETVADGKITSVREYFDNKHLDVLIDALQDERDGRVAG